MRFLSPGSISCTARVQEWRIPCVPDVLSPTPGRIVRRRKMLPRTASRAFSPAWVGISWWFGQSMMKGLAATKTDDPPPLRRPCLSLATGEHFPSIFPAFSHRFLHEEYPLAGGVDYTTATTVRWFWKPPPHLRLPLIDPPVLAANGWCHTWTRARRWPSAWTLSERATTITGRGSSTTTSGSPTESWRERTCLIILGGASSLGRPVSWPCCL